MFCVVYCLEAFPLFQNWNFRGKKNMAIGKKWRSRCQSYRSLSAVLSGRSADDLPWRQDPADDRRIELVFALSDVPGVVFDPENEDRQGSFFVERFSRDRHGKDTVEAAFAVGGLVAVLADVPGEDASLVEIIGEAVAGFG